MTKDGDGSKSGKDANFSVDGMSPYYIHPSDNPGQLCVSEILRDSNYGDWVEEMSNFLFAKNKIGFVDGSIPIPEDGDPREMALWRRCNAMVKGWLATAMEKEIRSSVKHTKTAKEIWDDLEERFGKVSAPRAYELKRALTFTRQDKMSVSAYYTKLKGIWDEIGSISSIPKCSCGKCVYDVSKQFMVIQEKERLYEFLMGLDEVFNIVKTQILSTNPIPSLVAAYHLVAEDEQQRLITAARKPTIESAAFQTQRQQGGGNRRDEKREIPKCSNCGRLYHTVENCYKIIGYPEPSKKGKGKQTDGKRADERQKEPYKVAHVYGGSSHASIPSSSAAA